MRSEEEIRALFDSVGEVDDDPGAPKDAFPFMDWQGDTFKFGYLIGKMMALGWVLGDPMTGDIKNNYDFVEWLAEEHARRTE